MTDLPITDLIAEAQERFALSPECYSDQHIEVRLTKALKNAQTTLEADEEYINKIESKVAVLESVTAPTKLCTAKRNDAYGTPLRCIIGDEKHDRPHIWQRISVTVPTENTEAPLKAAMEALDRKENWSRDPDSSGWVYDIQSGARSIIARGFRLPVPVEPSAEVSS